MKKHIILFFYLSFSSFFLACQFQKNEYKKIEIAYFIPSGEKDNLSITGYLHIDKNGVIKNFNENRRDKTLEFADISSPDSITKKINLLFSNIQKLKDYEVSTKLEENEFFAGEYFYIRLENDNGEVDSLCTIQPFLNSKFNNTFNSFQEYIYDSENRKLAQPFKIPSLFRASLNAAYKQCDYLPAIISPPPFIKEN